jgi:hypothetical protein
MAEQTQETRAKIPLKRFLADYKAGVPDREVMQKYGLSARSLISLIKTLMDKNVLSPDDLARRKQMTEQVELVKEQQFLKGLFICPKCGHPHPQQFDVCPACEAKLDDYAEPERVVEDVTTTGGFFYVEDTTAIVDEPEDGEDKTEPIRQEEPKLAAPTESIDPPKPEPPIPATHPEASEKAEAPLTPEKEPPPKESEQDGVLPVEKPERDKPQPEKKPEQGTSQPESGKDEPKEKSSPFKSVRALISKIRKP